MFNLLSLQLKTLKTIALICLFSLLSACQPNTPQLTKVVFTGPMMGTQYRITVLLDEHTEANVDAIEKSVVTSMEAVNQSMSTYLPDSELNKVNSLNARSELRLSKPLYDVIQESIYISELSNGAFDITIGKAVNLWGFGPDGNITEYPNEQDLEKIKQSIGYQKILLQNQSIIKKAPNMSLDLSAIAKGYAVDQVANAIDKFDIENYLIDIGGELRAQGQSQSNKTWAVGIEKPYTLGSIQEIISLRNKSIATSGDYRNYHVIDGKQFSHTIDALTLKPVFHRLALVSVIDNNASTADALATAIMALGDQKGWEFAVQHNLTIYMVIREDKENTYRVQMTDNFKQYLQ